MVPSLSREYRRQNILIHQISLLGPLSTSHLPYVLLLILRQNQVIPPSTFPSATMFGSLPLLICCPSCSFGYAIDISLVVPLHILLQMQLNLALVVRRATHPRQRRLSASRTKLLGHIFRRRETGVTPQNELLYLRDSLACPRGEEVEVHLQEDVLHRKVAGHGCDLEMFRMGLRRILWTRIRLGLFAV